MPSRRRISLLAGLWLAAAPPEALAQDTVVRITEGTCRNLAIHVPDPDLAYRPGRDVRGREVAPADLGARPEIALPETVTIDIEIDLADRLGIPAREGAFDPDVEIGTVEIGPDGRATFNGRPLQSEDRFELARRCREVLAERP